MSSVTRNSKAGTVTSTRGAIKAYRSEPANAQAAAVAAAHYAKRDGREYVAIKGNSYGTACYHITTVENADSVTVMAGKFNAFLAQPNGEIYNVTINVT